MTDKHRQRHRAAAKLRLISFRLGEWQIDECLNVSRKDNNRLFEAEMDLKRIARKVWRGYE